MSLGIFCFLAICILVAAFVQSIIGVGFALIVVPMVAFLQPALLPVFAIVLVMPLNVYVLWRERHSLDWSGASWITAGRAVGTFGGLAVLATFTRTQLNLFIGVATLAAAILTLMRPKFDPNRVSFIGAGVVTGITETATGIGGPPLALVYQHQPGPVLRATLAACFLIGEVFTLTILAATHRIDMDHVIAAIWLFPPIAVGVWLSKALHQRLAGAWLRYAVLAFAMASGLFLIYQGLRA